MRLLFIQPISQMQYNCDLVNYELFVNCDSSVFLLFLCSLSGWSISVWGGGEGRWLWECLLYLGIPGIQEGGGGTHSNTEISAIPAWPGPQSFIVFIRQLLPSTAGPGPGQEEPADWRSQVWNITPPGWLLGSHWSVRLVRREISHLSRLHWTGGFPRLIGADK